MPLLNYFAYGSNMSLARLRARVPSTKFISLAMLSGHELRFHKRSDDGSAKCDAYEPGNPDSEVTGILYTINDTEKRNLNLAEWLGYGYDIKEVVLMLADGNQVTAFT
jgi:gamma-glutamylcyclotransferase